MTTTLHLSLPESRHTPFKSYSSPHPVNLGRGSRSDSSCQALESGLFRAEGTKVMSQRHARIVWSDDGTVPCLVDEESTNGTSIERDGDDKKLLSGAEYALKNGDMITFGKSMAGGTSGDEVVRPLQLYVTILSSDEPFPSISTPLPPRAAAAVSPPHSSSIASSQLHDQPPSRQPMSYPLTRNGTTVVTSEVIDLVDSDSDEDGEEGASVRDRSVAFGRMSASGRTYGLDEEDCLISDREVDMDSTRSEVGSSVEFVEQEERNVRKLPSREEERERIQTREEELFLEEEERLKNLLGDVPGGRVWEDLCEFSDQERHDVGWRGGAYPADEDSVVAFREQVWEKRTYFGSDQAEPSEEKEEEEEYARAWDGASVDGGHDDHESRRSASPQLGFEGDEQVDEDEVEDEDEVSQAELDMRAKQVSPEEMDHFLAEIGVQDPPQTPVRELSPALATVGASTSSMDVEFSESGGVAHVESSSSTTSRGRLPSPISPHQLKKPLVDTRSDDEEDDEEDLYRLPEKDEAKVLPKVIFKPIAVVSDDEDSHSHLPSPASSAEEVDEPCALKGSREDAEDEALAMRAWRQRSESLSLSAEIDSEDRVASDVDDGLEIDEDDFDAPESEEVDDDDFEADAGNAVMKRKSYYPGGPCKRVKSDEEEREQDMEVNEWDRQALAEIEAMEMEVDQRLESEMDCEVLDDHIPVEVEEAVTALLAAVQEPSEEAEEEPEEVVERYTGEICVESAGPAFQTPSSPPTSSNNSFVLHDDAEVRLPSPTVTLQTLRDATSPSPARSVKRPFELVEIDPEDSPLAFKIEESSVAITVKEQSPSPALVIEERAIAPLPKRARFAAFKPVAIGVAAGLVTFGAALTGLVALESAILDFSTSSL
ncbi:FHA domain containing protein [Pseudohyphozyma bogoriensis]|nr:FHA domain containing protein [Pseudohyphozyma bogoriensis]